MELLKSDPVNALEYQEHIYREVERLYELSDLLLKLSSLDVGVVDLNKTSFSAKELVIDAELSLEYLMRQKAMSIEVSGDDFILEADRVWLLQALINVVKMLWKFLHRVLRFAFRSTEMPFFRASRSGILVRGFPRRATQDF